jgi:RHS repeat-associated protein
MKPIGVVHIIILTTIVTMTSLWGGPSAIAQQTLVHDANGNLVSKTDVNGTTTYTYDARNRLIAVNGPGVTATFTYDVLGRRTSKTVNGATSQYLHDGADVVQEVAGGAVGATYLRGLNVDEPFVQSSTPEYYHTDALGSVVALSNASGVTATSYAYEPFGKNTVNGASANPFQFTGRENDGTGLYYYRARYYNPQLGRFLNEDPLRFGGGDVNLFAYANNNPINFTDPSGLLSAGLPAPPGCLPPLDKREKYTGRFVREALCSLDFLPAVGGVNISGKVLKHVMEKHFPGATVEGGSIFGQGEKIADLLQNIESVAPVVQPNGNFQRIADAGRIVGTDVTTGQPTSIYTVITDAANNLKTMHPGSPNIPK